MLRWTEKHSTGSPQLDLQHQTLINKLNELGKALLAANPSVEDYQCMVSMVDYVEGYAIRHFAAEEACMERFRCPAHAKNQRTHEEFKTFFAAFKQQCQSQGIRREFVVALHATLARWVDEHILKVDAQLKPCFKA